MHTDQARQIIAAHDTVDRCLANLRNAGAMTADDPKSQELLERAGDSYAVGVGNLLALQAEVGVFPEFGERGSVGDPGLPGEPGPDGEAGSPPPVFESGKAVYLVGEGNTGAGFVSEHQKVAPDGMVAVRLTTAATYSGDDHAEGSTITVPAADVSLEPAPSDPGVPTT